jgi:hypothetical protein
LKHCKLASQSFKTFIPGKGAMGKINSSVCCPSQAFSAKSNVAEKAWQREIDRRALVYFAGEKMNLSSREKKAQKFTK